jgi:transposase
MVAGSHLPRFCYLTQYYKNELVYEYLKTSKIKLLFMPPYSPNLNLIERLWKFMPKTILYNRYYEKFADFKVEVMRFFNNIGQYTDKLSTLLAKNFQILGV